MITLAGASSASVATLAGLQQAMLGAGHSIAALSSGEVPAANAASGGAALTSEPAQVPADTGVGRIIDTLA